MMGINTSSDSSDDVIHASEEFAIVERVARIVSSVYGARPDYTRLAAELAQAISFDVFGIVLLQHDRKAVRVTVCQRQTGVLGSEVPQQWVAHYHQHPFTDSMLQRLSNETTLIVNDYPQGLSGSPAESGDALSSYPHLRSTCIVPMHTKGRILGTLELGSVTPANYANDQLQRLIGAVAQVLSAALERTQLEGNAEIQDRQRQALKDVSRALTSAMDLTTILTHITDGVAKALHVASMIVTFDQHQAKVQLAAQSGLDETFLRTLLNDTFVLTDSCILGSTLLHGQSYMSNDIQVDERFPASYVLTSALSIHSVLSYPLEVQNTMYGALLLCSPDTGGFSPLKADIVALFASQATLALHNAALVEADSQRKRFQDAIERLEQAVSTRKLSKAREYELLVRAREEAQRTFGVSLASILRFVSDTLLVHNEPEVRRMLLKESQLAQSADTVLARTGIVGELSALLMQVQPATKGIKDAWFVTDLQGRCMYMNPVAEALCHVQLADIEKTAMSLEVVFSSLLAYIRNSDEVRRYLQDFAFGSLYKQELRCVVALEVVHVAIKGDTKKQRESLSSTTNWQKDSQLQQHSGKNFLRTMKLENMPSDTHYLLTRHPLHSQQGHLTAYALQAHDITTQVRDEKNKASLLSSVSHDLRTPLTTIKAAVTGLLQKDIPWDEQMRREMLEDIDAETDHLTVLVSALVEMSRIEMGALILEKEWCDITEIIYEALMKAKRVLATRNVKTQFQSSLPLLFIDHVQIERVLSHLLENAAHHTQENTEILIEVDVVTGEATPPMVRVQVVDEGSGVSAYERERIFKSFYGLQAQGSGLGLAICKGIIEMHSGRIWVETAQKGARFIFTLPVDPVMG